MDNEKDFPLYTLKKFLEMRFLKSPYSKTCFFVIFVAIQVYNIIGLQWMIQKRLFRQYITYVMLTQGGVMGAIATLTFILYSKMPQVHPSWDLKSATVKTRSQIDRESRSATWVTFFMVAYLTFVHIFAVLPIFGDEEHIIHFLAVARYYHENLLEITEVFLALFLSVLGLLTGYSLAFPTYILTTANIQLRLLIGEIKKIHLRYKRMHPHSEFIWGEDVQDDVYRVLQSCVKHHINLIRSKSDRNNVQYMGNDDGDWLRRFKDENFDPSDDPHPHDPLQYIRASQKEFRLPIMFLPMSCVTPAAAVYFIVNDISPRSNIRMFLIVAIYFILMVHLSTIGQEMENLCQEMFVLVTQCPWIHWNKKNRQALLMLLINCMEPLSIKGVMDVSLNFRILKIVGKGIYTLFTVLY